MANQAAAKAAPKPKGEGILSRLMRFLRESYIETRYKSAWPTWAELRSFTLVVIFALIVVGTWIGVIDSVLTWITQRLAR